MRIEAVRDDCMPPLANGDWGSAIVMFTNGGGPDGQSASANVPLGAVSLDPQHIFDTTRSDISFNTTLIFDRTSPVPGCPARSHLELATLALDSAGIDVEWKSTYTGVASCSRQAIWIPIDCTSDRIFHFEWLRACGPGSDYSHCL